MNTDDEERRMERITKNNLMFRIGVILAIGGLLFILMGDMSIYNGVELIFTISTGIIGVIMVLIGGFLTIVTTVAFRGDYGLGG